MSGFTDIRDQPGGACAPADTPVARQSDLRDRLPQQQSKRSLLTFRRLGYMGRLGNQMFQYAALVAAAKRLGVRWGLEFRNEHIARTVDGRTQSRPHPRCSILVKESLELSRAFDITAVRAKPTAKTFRESQFRYDSQFTEIAPGTDLCGYFQSPKYFAGFEEQIRREFTFRKPIRAAADRIVLPRDTLLVSLHVRRGDYLAQWFEHFVDLWSDGYYQRAMAHFGSDVQFVCFSDDVPWCRAHLQSGTIYVDSGSSYVDLCVMSRCDHHIIANSSYSWWGAWLNPNPAKQVIAPKPWFGPEFSDFDTADLCSEEWLRI